MAVNNLPKKCDGCLTATYYKFIPATCQYYLMYRNSCPCQTCLIKGICKKECEKKAWGTVI
jgi:sulfur relay (sulfurtransferase) DsrC/TusE family protein